MSRDRRRNAGVLALGLCCFTRHAKKQPASRFVLIAFPIVYFGRELLLSFGYANRRQLGATTFGALILASVISVLLTPPNCHLLKWRKDGGRNIEDEERYETDHGMIKLTPNQDINQDAR